MMKPLAPYQKMIGYLSLISVGLCTIMGLFIIWLMLTSEL
jgi:hypothetical protein